MPSTARTATTSTRTIRPRSVPPRSWPRSATSSATARSSHSARATTRARCSTSSAGSTPTTSRPSSSSARRTSGPRSRPSSPRTAGASRAPSVAAYTLKDLEYWDERVREKVAGFGLDCFAQEFEICDHALMLGYMAYSGMPSHYPHWSYGKSYEKLKTLYDYGVSGIPYEMVINSDPALAYLMRDNSLCLQILTIAHVYGHNDFFKNNFTFKSTRAEFTISTFKTHGNRVRTYAEDPSIGLEKVEAVLDSAHAISLQCRRNLGIRKRTPAEERERLIAAATPREDPFHALHRRHEYLPPDLK